MGISVIIEISKKPLGDLTASFCGGRRPYRLPLTSAAKSNCDGTAQAVDRARRANHRHTCPALFAKIFPLPFEANHLLISRHPGPHKGAFRDRHERRAGMRWTQAALLTRALFLRTVKSCGPDAPTLASSSREASFLGARVATKPGHPGEREGNR